MGPPLTDFELQALYPQLEPWQRAEQERYWRGRHHALMEGLQLPADAPPWPEHPSSRPQDRGSESGGCQL